MALHRFEGDDEMHVHGRDAQALIGTIRQRKTASPGRGRLSHRANSAQGRAGEPSDNTQLTICERAAEKIIAYEKNSCIAFTTRLCAARPISHVPVAACRLVGIRTRGRTAARSKRRKVFRPPELRTT